jgi:DNA repair exonuclease SbcCD ATPase subunit
MSDPLLGQQIEQLRKQLSTVDAQLAKGTANEGLEDLKGAVDNLRTSVWAVLSASRTSNYPGFISRFRLRRSIDILRTIVADLDNDAERILHPEHSEMQILMQQINDRIGKLKQGK